MEFILIANARKIVTICFHNFIRGNSRWARYVDEDDDDVVVDDDDGDDDDDNKY
jgi:hypothetical protein